MSSPHRVIGTRSKSRDEQDSKENVENDERTAAPKTPGTAKTSRSASSLFSPPLSGSPSSYSMHSETMKKQPDPFPDNWEEVMGAPSSASRRSRAREPPDSFGYGMSQQADSKGDDRKVMSWESRDRGMGNVHRQDCGGNNYGSLAADLEMAAREGVADDFPAVADCFNLGSFAEESPPRRQRTSPKGSPHSYEQGQPYPYRSSPPPYPPSGMPHGSPHHHYPPSGPPYPPAGVGPPPMYYQGPPSGSPYGYPQVPPPHGGPYRYAHQPYQGDPWMSPPAQFPDFAPPGRGTPPHGSPPPKKRRSSDWGDNGRSSSSSPGGEEEGSTTPEKAFPEKHEPMRSPFRSPVPTGERSSAKKSKRSPLFQGGTPGIAAYGSWDTPGGSLNAALGDEFSPMGPFAPFADESLEGAPEAPMTFDSKLSLAASSSGEDPGPSHPPAIRQRPSGQPAASPFSAFVGDLSPFPPPPPMRGSPVNLDHRDYVARHHPGYHAYHRSPPDVFPRHPGMPTPSKRSGLGGPAGRHPMASPVMSGSAQRQQSWYEHVAPSPGPFRLELGDGKSRKGFEDINSLLRGATGPPPPHQRPTPSPPQDVYGSAGRPRSASSQDLSTPIKSDGHPPGSSGRGSSYHGSARKTPRGSATPTYTALSKSMGTAATPGSKTPSSGGSGGPTSMSKKMRRNPCNCKKSKCLKLYCECFAGELYCDGCNCNDCHNTPAYESERQKAMKDTRAKNPNAFKARITVKPGPASTGTTTPARGHNMGCRCKKSECLKKYCECFQAGVMCAGKCKCVDCLNYVGSQALIDKRRKMKDHRGAEMAMRIAEEAWKGGKHSAPRNVRSSGLKPSPVGRGRPPLPMPHMMQPSPSPHHRGPPPPPGYMGPMMGHPHPHSHMGYSSMNMPPVTPGYAHGKQQMMPGGGRGMISAKDEPKVDLKKHQSGLTPKSVTPRTPAVRLGFDPHSSKKKRKLGPGEREPTFPFFGDRPEQPKTTALAIFSYLSNDDLFNSTLVCKQWNKLAMDDELWQF